MRRLLLVLVASLLVIPVAAAARIVTVGAAQNGKTVTLRSGDTLAVKLAANGTTGFAWSVQSYNRSVLQHIGSSYTRIHRPQGGGVATLRFKAIARKAPRP